jgi:succinate dehydrogenase/fumarate reductase flavoprotein subunit
MTTLSCDLLVIGSGAGGLSAAVTAAFHGLKVVVAEKEPVFGAPLPGPAAGCGRL